MDTMDRSTQSGPIVHIEINGLSFRTKEFTLVRNAGGARRYYPSIGYGAHRGYFRVKTRDLHPNSDAKILFICSKCKRQTNRIWYLIQRKHRCRCELKTPHHLQQFGPMILIGRHRIGKNVPFRTQKFTWIPSRGKIAKQMARFRIKQFSETDKFAVLTAKLPVGCRKQIKFICPVDGCFKETIKPISTIAIGKNCRSCSYKARGLNRRLNTISVLEKSWNIAIDVESFTGLRGRTLFTKNECGCVLRRDLDSIIKSKDIIRCECTGLYPWEILEQWIRNKLNGISYIIPDIQREIDCIVGNLALEVKLNQEALLPQARGKKNRHPLKVIRECKKWASQNSFHYYVLINNSSATADRSAIPKDLKQIMLFREQWGLVGLDEQFQERCRQLETTPGRFHVIRRLSKGEQQLLRQFKVLSEKQGYILTSKQCFSYLKVSRRTIMMLAFGDPKYHAIPELITKLNLEVAEYPKGWGGIKNSTLYKLEGVNGINSTASLAKELQVSHGYFRARLKRTGSSNSFFLPSGPFLPRGGPNKIPRRYWGKKVTVVANKNRDS